MENNNYIVQIKHLDKFYGKKFCALHNINLNIESGKIVGLLGPNGAGKTTMIKILSGMIQNYHGEVLINNMPIGIETKKIVSYLPDSEFLDPDWTVSYSLEYYSTFFDDFDKEKALKLIDQLGLDLKKKFSKLSKGTKEKLQLILTLSRNAKLYIFDEPIAGVDPAARDLIFKLILDNCAKDATILISTHLISDAEKILDDYIFIKKGGIVEIGNVKQVREETGKTIDEIFREEFSCLQDF